MGGGVLQLAAKGAADVYLTGGAQITHFKMIYRRHVDFAIEQREFPFSDTPGFGKRCVCRLVADDFDLISRTSLQVTLPAIPVNSSWIPFVGEFLIKEAIFEVGGMTIDRQYGEWLHIWNELMCPAGKERNYLHCVNGYGGVRVPEKQAESLRAQTNRVISDLALRGTDAALGCGLTVNSPGPEYTGDTVMDMLTSEIPEHTLTIPLQFFFTRHVGLSLPLKKLGNTPVNIILEFADRQHLINQPRASPPIRDIVSASILADCVKLDSHVSTSKDKGPLEYLIEQVQVEKETITHKDVKIRLGFTGLVKELVWVVQSGAYRDPAANSPWRFSDAEGNNPVSSAKIQFNTHDRFSTRDGDYFNRVQPYQYHTASPSTGINVYNFGLHPEDSAQPSGSCNFSKLDVTLSMRLTDAAFRVRGQNYEGTPLVIDSVPANVTIYATNYNIFRVADGYGGLVYPDIIRTLPSHE